MLLISLMCGVINRKQPSHTGLLIQIKMCCTFFFRADALICSYLSIFSFLLYKLREISLPFGSYTWAEKIWWNFNIFLYHIFTTSGAVWLQSLPASESTSIIRGHLCVIPSFVGHHHNFPRVVVVIETMMNVFILTTKLSSSTRLSNISDRLIFHAVLKLTITDYYSLSPNKKWFFADGNIHEMSSYDTGFPGLWIFCGYYHSIIIAIGDFLANRVKLLS